MPRTVAQHAPLFMEFSRREYWSELSFPTPRHLPNPGIKPGSPVLQADPLPSEPPGRPWEINYRRVHNIYLVIIFSVPNL